MRYVTMRIDHYGRVFARDILSLPVSGGKTENNRRETENMPYISTKTNVSVSEAQRRELEKKLGKAIELIPGKSESWLMLSFEPETAMAFQGSEEATAMLEVKLFGKASAGAYSDMTKALTKIISEELQIPAARIYVKYEECAVWGWNGENF